MLPRDLELASASRSLHRDSWSFGGVSALLREKIGPREKALWTAIMFILVLLEIRSIYLDQKQHDKEQADARALLLQNFQTIATGIERVVGENRRDFDTTIGRLESTIRLSRQNLEQAEGGHGFPYFVALVPGALIGGGTKWPLDVINSEKLPLLNVNAVVREMIDPHDSSEEMIRKWNSGVLLNLGTVLSVKQGGTFAGYSVAPGSYTIDISTRNNRFTEILDIKPDKNSATGYVEHYEIYHFGDAKLLFRDGKPSN